MPTHLRTAALALIAFGAFAVMPARAADTPSADQQAFRDIYRELVEINTTDSVGDTVRAAQAMAAMDIQLLLKSAPTVVMWSSPAKRATSSRTTPMG